jgi:hypothetical protein
MQHRFIYTVCGILYRIVYGFTKTLIVTFTGMVSWLRHSLRAITTYTILLLCSLIGFFIVSTGTPWGVLHIWKPLSVSMTPWQYSKQGIYIEHVSIPQIFTIEHSFLAFSNPLKNTKAPKTDDGYSFTATHLYLPIKTSNQPSSLWTMIQNWPNSNIQYIISQLPKRIYIQSIEISLPKQGSLLLSNTNWQQNTGITHTPWQLTTQFGHHLGSGSLTVTSFLEASHKFWFQNQGYLFVITAHGNTKSLLALAGLNSQGNASIRVYGSYTHTNQLAAQGGISWENMTLDGFLLHSGSAHIQYAKQTLYYTKAHITITTSTPRTTMLVSHAPMPSTESFIEASGYYNFKHRFPFYNQAVLHNIRLEQILQIVRVSHTPIDTQLQFAHTPIIVKGTIKPFTLQGDGQLQATHLYIKNLPNSQRGLPSLADAKPWDLQFHLYTDDRRMVFTNTHITDGSDFWVHVPTGHIQYNPLRVLFNIQANHVPLAWSSIVHPLYFDGFANIPNSQLAYTSRITYTALVSQVTILHPMPHNTIYRTYQWNQGFMHITPNQALLRLDQSVAQTPWQYLQVTIPFEKQPWLFDLSFVSVASQDLTFVHTHIPILQTELQSLSSQTISPNNHGMVQGTWSTQLSAQAPKQIHTQLYFQQISDAKQLSLQATCSQHSCQSLQGSVDWYGLWNMHTSQNTVFIQGNTEFPNTIANHIANKMADPMQVTSQLHFYGDQEPQTILPFTWSIKASADATLSSASMVATAHIQHNSQGFHINSALQGLKLSDIQVTGSIQAYIPISAQGSIEWQQAAANIKNLMVEHTSGMKIYLPALLTMHEGKLRIEHANFYYGHNIVATMGGTLNLGAVYNQAMLEGFFHTNMDSQSPMFKVLDDYGDCENCSVEGGGHIAWFPDTQEPWRGNYNITAQGNAFYATDYRIPFLNFKVWLHNTKKSFFSIFGFSNHHSLEAYGYLKTNSPDKVEAEPYFHVTADHYPIQWQDIGMISLLNGKLSGYADIIKQNNVWKVFAHINPQDMRVYMDYPCSTIWNSMHNTNTYAGESPIDYTVFIDSSPLWDIQGDCLQGSFYMSSNFYATNTKSNKNLWIGSIKLNAQSKLHIGDTVFTNNKPSRIEWKKDSSNIIDADAETQINQYTLQAGVHGSSNKPNLSLTLNPSQLPSGDTAKWGDILSMVLNHKIPYAASPFAGLLESYQYWTPSDPNSKLNALQNTSIGKSIAQNITISPSLRNNSLAWNIALQKQITPKISGSIFYSPGFGNQDPFYRPTYTNFSYTYSPHIKNQLGAYIGNSNNVNPLQPLVELYSGYSFQF